MATTVSWRALRGVDPALAAARLQAHYAAQWLARTARAYVAVRPDDGHTNLGWDDAFGGFLTHPLPDGTRAGLRIADLTLVLVDSRGVAPREQLALDGRCDADARAWLGRFAEMHGLDPAKLDAAPPYELPAHPVTNGAAYAATTHAAALAELATWYANANAVLAALRDEIAARGLDAPPVRCWPHHFDLDTLVTVAPGRTSGIGFVPGDAYYDAPYFYVSLHPAPDVATLPKLPSIGHWHAKNFTAAIATAQRIVAATDQGREVAAFLHAASDATIGALEPK